VKTDDLDSAPVGAEFARYNQAGMKSSQRPPSAPTRRGPSKGPALVVLGVAAGLILIFGALAVVSSLGKVSTVGPTKPVKVKGTTLLAVPAAKALKPIELPGTPPANILDALVVPEGATVVSVTKNSTSTTQYDEQMRFSVHAPEAAVVDFYRVELAVKGWSTPSVGSATGLSGAVEVLAQKAGDDGWYWEAGAIVSPTSFDTKSVAGSSKGTGAESTQFTLRLFQVSDDDG